MPKYVAKKTDSVATILQNVVALKSAKRKDIDAKNKNISQKLTADTRTVRAKLDKDLAELHEKITAERNTLIKNASAKTETFSAKAREEIAAHEKKFNDEKIEIDLSSFNCSEENLKELAKSLDQHKKIIKYIGADTKVLTRLGVL